MASFKGTKTFESRLKFLASVFNNLYSQQQILTSCINYKLQNQLSNYKDALEASFNKLASTDPVKTLQRLTMED